MEKETIDNFLDMSRFVKAPFGYMINVEPANIESWASLKIVENEYCRKCKKERTFIYKGGWEHGMYDPLDVFMHNKHSYPFGSIITYCALCPSCNEPHYIMLNVSSDRQNVIKVGQYPTLLPEDYFKLADYRSVISEDDYPNLVNAINAHIHGLDAAGLLYMRRIYESLVNRLIAQFPDIQFRKKNSEQRIPKFYEKLQALEKHGILIFPEELIDLKKSFYHFISEGVHEWSDDKCREYYDILFFSVLQILKAEKDRVEKEEMKKQLLSAYQKEGK